MPGAAISAVVLDIFGELYNHIVSYCCEGSLNCLGFFVGGYACFLWQHTGVNLHSHGSFFFHTNDAQNHFPVHRSFLDIGNGTLRGFCDLFFQKLPFSKRKLLFCYSTHIYFMYSYYGSHFNTIRFRVCITEKATCLYVTHIYFEITAVTNINFLKGYEGTDDIAHQVGHWS